MGLTRPLTGTAVGRPGVSARSRRRPRRGPLALLLVMAVLGGSAAYLTVRGPVPPWSTRPASVLLVGDSLLWMASGEVADQSSGRARVTVLAASGASPCDIWAGYPVPGQADRASFRATLLASRPRAVVLAFTGNAGFPGTGCAPHPTGNFTLDALLLRYRAALVDLGRTAEATGARVYLAASPPRNPAAPEGWDGTYQHGYNGDPAINRMLSGLAASWGWVYDDGAARQLSSPSGGWTVAVPCQPADGPGCSEGLVQVRAGGPDPIHCDVPGSNGAGSPSAGSLRYAFGLLDRPLRDQGARAAGLSRLGAC